MDSSTLENTFGIDCYRYANLDGCGEVGAEATDSPMRLSSDFFTGVIGFSPPSKRRRGINSEYVTPQRTLRSRTSTPRRSMRLQAVEKLALKAPEKLGVKAQKKMAAKAPEKVVQKGQITKPKPSRPLAQPRSTKTIELRKQAIEKAQNQTGKNNRAQTMKPKISHKQQQHHSTVARTPEMIRRLRQPRIRTNYHKSIEEKEDEEVKKMKSYTFKARPVPQSVKKAPPKAKLPHKPPTVAKSPKIALSNKRKIDEVDPHVEFKAKPVPTYRKVPLVRKSEMPNTSVKPFSFDSKYADPNVNKKKLMEEELSKLQKAREFKAQPMPSSNAENVPPKTYKQRAISVLPTFELPGDSVSKKKKLAFQTKIEEEEVKRRSEAQFKSREPNVLRKKPFKPVL